jgi:methyl acetate hydrolase
MSKTWGLTFQINDHKAPTGGLLWAGLANSSARIDAQTGSGGVYLTQVLPFAHQEAVPLYWAFETAIYA